AGPGGRLPAPPGRPGLDAGKGYRQKERTQSEHKNVPGRENVAGSRGASLEAEEEERQGGARAQGIPSPAEQHEHGEEENREDRVAPGQRRRGGRSAPREDESVARSVSQELAGAAGRHGLPSQRLSREIERAAELRRFHRERPRRIDDARFARAHRAAVQQGQRGRG